MISHFGFEGSIWVLIASVPDLCILLTFCNPISFMCKIIELYKQYMRIDLSMKTKIKKIKIRDCLLIKNIYYVH